MHKISYNYNRTLNVCSPLNAAEYLFFKDISCSDYFVKSDFSTVSNRLYNLSRNFYAVENIVRDKFCCLLLNEGDGKHRC